MTSMEVQWRNELGEIDDLKMAERWRALQAKALSDAAVFARVAEKFEQKALERGEVVKPPRAPHHSGLWGTPGR